MALLQVRTKVPTSSKELEELLTFFGWTVGSVAGKAYEGVADCTRQIRR